MSYFKTKEGHSRVPLPPLPHFHLHTDKVNFKLLKKLCFVGFASESDEAEESEGAGGLESDEDDEGKERLLNAKEGIEDDTHEGRKRTTSEDGNTQRKKKKSRQIVESDEDSD